MKTYDFETVVRRNGVGSGKWNEIENTLGYTPEGIIPFSVADMEFVMAPEIVEGLQQFLNHYVLGYATPTQAYKEAVKSWMKKRHNWDIETDWIRDTPGVINAFFTAVKAFTKEGDGIMLMTPVYYPMYFAIERHNRVLVDSPLVRVDDTYEINFEDFEKKAADKNTKMLILCSPHNPSGRVWTVDELKRIGDVCVKNHVLIVSDEIHFDLVSPGHKHTVLASISKAIADNTVTCTAPSKTFNLAGLQTSNIIISNPELRAKFYEEQRRSDGNPKCNILGLEACRIAYTECEEWLDQALAVIEKNRQVILKYVKEELPQVHVMKPEGTYLLWLNFNELGIECHELAKILKEEAYLFFDEGYIFGASGEGFERWNLACPTKYIEEGLERLKSTLSKYLK